MCLYSEWKEPKVMAKDKVVWKVVYTESSSRVSRINKTLYSPYRDTIFKDKNKTILNWFRCWSLSYQKLVIRCNRGLHAMLLLTEAEGLRNRWEIDSWKRHYKVIKCVIPKGSLYFVGRQGDKTGFKSIVSTQLNILKTK
jgi:hypothetical protein